MHLSAPLDGRHRRLEGSVSAFCEGLRISALGVGGVREALENCLKMTVPLVKGGAYVSEYLYLCFGTRYVLDFLFTQWGF